MNATTRRIEETIELIRTLKDAVGQVAPWNDRHYVNLRHADRTFAGDRNDKFYLDDRGVLIYQQGKGTNSAGFQADKRALLALCDEAGIVVEKR